MVFLQIPVPTEETNILFKTFGIAAVIIIMIYLLARFLESRVKEQQETIHEKDKKLISAKEEQIATLKADKTALNNAYQEQVAYIRRANEGNLKTLMELTSLIDRLVEAQKDGKLDILKEIQTTAQQIKTEINRINA